MTTTTQPTVATPTRSRATRAFGLFAAVGVLVTANVAFAAPAATSGRELVSPAPTHTPTQGDLLRTTSTPTVVVANREPSD